ncbi:MAG: OsmC family protein [Clostridia bacterium]|nr:OsmC family protein [Clostridia bacterium]
MLRLKQSGEEIRKERYCVSKVIMSTLKVDVNFNDTFSGQLVGPRGQAEIGAKEGTVAPYDMLFGALASCLHATFMGIAQKKKISYESVHYEVTGEKREEVPTILKWVNVKMTVKNAEKEAGLIKAAELASQYCSIYHTLSQIAEMKLDVEFID